jgi:MoxR-like ATPase
MPLLPSLDRQGENVAQPATARRTQTAALFDALSHNVQRVIQGKREQVRLALICLFAEGHLLIEDVPGVGKTSMAKAIASSIAATAHRIQFTPDLLPSDVTGVSVWNRSTSEFEFRPGGVFAHVVLADEINRASPKTQSALLEAMEERQVTVDARTYALPRPFLVIATQNPVELEGTYPLPEAQLDRFLMRVPMGYPSRDAEIGILETQGAGQLRAEGLEPVASAAEITSAADDISSVHVAPALQAYIVDLADATRRHPDLALGVSPRGALAVQRAARALAVSAGREYVIPDDVKVLAPYVLEHRMLLAPEAELRGVTAHDVLGAIISTVPVPGAAG